MRDTWIVTEVCNVGECMNGITVDDNGYIYSTSSNTVYRIHKQNLHEEATIVIQIPPMNWLRGIVWNRNNNNLYICDEKNHRIFEYSLDTGNLSTLAGNQEEFEHKDGNFKDARFINPHGIAMDNNGYLYITERHYVRKINLSEETVITIAGSDESRHRDGEANQAVFTYPYGLVVSDDGTIYVADQYSHCIRKIKDGIVSTIAGTPYKQGNQDGPLSQSLFDHPGGLVLDVDGNFIVSDWNQVSKVDMNNQIVSTLKKIDYGVYGIYQLDAHTIIGSTKNNLLKLEYSWKWERFLWIGNKKENSSYCHLASLPKEIIREIANHFSQYL